MTWRELFLTLKVSNVEDLQDFLEKKYQTETVYPSYCNVFKCFEECSFDNLKVIIIGQDPYHEVNQANGLAFSVSDGCKITPSLKNIYKEIENEFNIKMDYNKTDLTYLAQQGVLLLNKYLTVKAGIPLSHKNKIYDSFFKDLISAIERFSNNTVVYLLWGNEAKKVIPYITNKKHFILTATHPSPLGANKGGWFNSNVFIKCNEILLNNHIKSIEWKNY